MNTDLSILRNPNHIQQLNGSEARLELPARHAYLSDALHIDVQLPYLVFMPEIDRVLMLFNTGRFPYRVMLTHSDDCGETWREPRRVRPRDTDGVEKEPSGLAGLTYIGDGKLLFSDGEKERWHSDDYGETWHGPLPFTPVGEHTYQWDPLLVDRDPATGRVVRLVEVPFGSSQDTVSGGACQGYIRFSEDEGKTWTPAAPVPEWKGYNETALCRAANGDIVAACRSENLPAFEQEIDWYGTTGISISTDNGATWTKPDPLYAYGRMHPCLALMPDGAIVMSYVVRMGYGRTPEGMWRYGVEALVSRDHGRSWDFDHRYVLASWHGGRKGLLGWWNSVQGTSTILLPDGSLLTAFGTFHRTQPAEDIKWYTYPRDIGLVRWRVNVQSLNSETAISDAPYNSPIRQFFDPTPLLHNSPYICLEQPEERRVFQRNRENYAPVPISGIREGDFDTIAARFGPVRDGIFAPAEWTVITADPNGERFSGALNMPAGGWYRVEVSGMKGGRQVAWAAVHSVGVGEVFITAGGYNSANWGETRTRPEDDRVSTPALSGWRLAEDPQPGSDGVGGSPWPALGDALANMLDVPIGIISTGVGGSEAAQWLRWWDGTDFFFRIRQALEYAGQNGVRAVLWHQGEADAIIGVTRAKYAALLRTIISQCRQEADWEVPWVIAGASYAGVETANEEAIRAAQQDVCEGVNIFNGPATDDLRGSAWRTGLHFTENGLREHGKRWAESLMKIFFTDPKGTEPG